MIDLPTSPGVSAGTPRLVDGGSWQQPIGGGATVYVGRPNGAHLAIDFTTPRIPLRGLARIWVVRLMRALAGEPARCKYPQPEIVIGAPGATVVDGAGIAGFSLPIRGGEPGYVVLEGQALNLYDSAGRGYIHLCAADTPIGVDGKATLPVTPIIRAAPANGSSANLLDPTIEGRLIGADKGVTLKRALADGLSFTIEELR